MGVLIEENRFKKVTTYAETVRQEMQASGSALVIMKDNKIVHEWYSDRHHFEQVTSVQSPNELPEHLPKFGFLWWMKDDKVTACNSELGSKLPEGSYQILGASGCSCTVLPKFNLVAVRMYNSVNASKNVGFDYIKDIQKFGNLITETTTRC